MALVWSVDFHFAAPVLRTNNPVQVVISQIAQLHGSASHDGVLHTILSELCTNAIDHGILSLNSLLKKDQAGFVYYYQLRQERLDALETGYLRVRISEWHPENASAYLELTVEDSGSGYLSTEAAPQTLPQKNAYCGRGLILVRELCHTVEVHAPGNCVQVTYILPSSQDANS